MRAIMCRQRSIMKRVRSLNNVSLVGNISNDVDLKYTTSGHAVARFNLAVTNPHNREKTSFIPVEVWRAQAENVSNYCRKGSKVGVVGHIEIDNYEKDGQKKTFTKVVANNVEFLTPKTGTESPQTHGNGQTYTNTPGNNQTPNTGNNGPYSTHDNNGHYRGPNSEYTPPQQNYTRVDEDPFSSGSGPIEVSDDDLPF